MNPENRFCHVEARIHLYIVYIWRIGDFFLYFDEDMTFAVVLNGKHPFSSQIFVCV